MNKRQWFHRAIYTGGLLIRDEIVDQDGKIIVEDVSSPEDAPIVSAAPEMLDALKTARSTFIVEYGGLGEVQTVSYDGNALRPLIAFLDSAIRKAEGRAS